MMSWFQFAKGSLTVENAVVADFGASGVVSGPPELSDLLDAAIVEAASNNADPVDRSEEELLGDAASNDLDFDGDALIG